MKFIATLAVILIMTGAGCLSGGNGNIQPEQPDDNGYPIDGGTTTTTPTSTPAQTMKVKIFLVALDQQQYGGNPAEVIGCGDRMIPVDVTIPKTTAPLTAAMKELLRVKTQYYGQSGLYNALYQSFLQVQNISIVNGKATIKLTGTMQLGGVCDNPRFEEQIKRTALQFPTVSSVEIFVNGKKLSEILSGRGEDVQNMPVVTSITPNPVSVGAKIEIKGKNFSGFEGDLNAWIVNSAGDRGILYGEFGTSTPERIVTTLKSKVCKEDLSYTGGECQNWLNLVPGNYKIYVAPWGNKSNEVTLTIQ